MGIELAIIGAMVAQGFAQKNQADANADYYKQVAANQAKARDVARYQEQKQNLAYRSNQLAQIGKSGVQLTGTPLGLVKRTAEEQEMDILIADYNAEIEQADTLQRAAMQEQAGDQALLGSITSAATMGYDMKQTSGSLSQG